MEDTSEITVRGRYGKQTGTVLATIGLELVRIAKDGLSCQAKVSVGNELALPWSYSNVNEVELLTIGGKVKLFCTCCLFDLKLSFEMQMDAHTGKPLSAR